MPGGAGFQYGKFMQAWPRMDSHLQVEEKGGREREACSRDTERERKRWPLIPEGITVAYCGSMSPHGTVLYVHEQPCDFLPSLDNPLFWILSTYNHLLSTVTSYTETYNMGPLVELDIFQPVTFLYWEDKPGDLLSWGITSDAAGGRPKA